MASVLGHGGGFGERELQTGVGLFDQGGVAVGLGQAVEEVGKGHVPRECDPKTLQLVHLLLLPLS